MIVWRSKLTPRERSPLRVQYLGKEVACAVVMITLATDGLSNQYRNDHFYNTKGLV